MGKFHAQTFDERVAIFETVKGAVGGQIPLVAGVGCASTIETMILEAYAQGGSARIGGGVSSAATPGTLEEIAEVRKAMVAFGVL
jgi:dihydrodipicolinate synthase/N-acetylneuraminate lyase